MKQTHIPTAWQTGILSQVRRQTENLMLDYEALPAATTPAGVERAAKALLAIVKLARAADDSLPVADAPVEPDIVPAPHLPNRQERRRLAAEARHALPLPLSP